MSDSLKDLLAYQSEIIDLMTSNKLMRNDQELYERLRVARNAMPEPARFEWTYFYTTNKNFNGQVWTIESEDEWQKVLVTEDSTQYWAWKHCNSGIILI